MIYVSKLDNSLDNLTFLCTKENNQQLPTIEIYLQEYLHF